MNAAEKRFRDLARSKHWGIIRPSWPDFLCRDGDELFAVEVKHDNDWVSDKQRETFDFLTRHGFRVLIWHTAFHKTLFEWEDVRDDWPGRDRKRS